MAQNIHPVFGRQSGGPGFGRQWRPLAVNGCQKRSEFGLTGIENPQFRGQIAIRPKGVSFHDAHFIAVTLRQKPDFEGVLVCSRKEA